MFGNLYIKGICIKGHKSIIEGQIYDLVLLTSLTSYYLVYNNEYIDIIPKENIVLLSEWRRKRLKEILDESDLYK